ncbi:MAG: DUF1835 domain-containing protein [Pseudomonadota bacterium]
MPLHLVNGDSARGAVTAATKSAEVIACRDVLSVGPLRTGMPPARFAALRNDFWQTVFGAEPLPHSTRLAQVLDRCRHAAQTDGLIIWVGAAASDQCMLAWVLDALCSDRDQGKVLLVDLAAGGNGVRGPAEFTPEALAACAAPEAVREQDWQAYAEAWRALTSETPESWPALAGKRRTPAALAAALRIMMRRFPDRVRGLSRLDEKLLTALVGGPASHIDVLRFAMRTGDADWRDVDYDTVGDKYLSWRLARMSDAALASPLVAGDHDAMSLTDAGRDVLAGRASAVGLNGVDDDVGGVSLRNGGPVWLRDADRVLKAS